MSTPSEEPTLHELLSRLAELEQAHARLQEELTNVRAERAPAAEEQASAQTRTRPRRSSRRKVLEKGLGVAVATVGAGAMLELSGGTALAASTPKPGVFASNVAGTPAVKATSTNGADGVDATSDSGTGVSATSSSGTGLVATSSSGLAGHFTGNVQMDNNLTVTGTLSTGAISFASSTAGTPAVKASGTNGADGVDASSDSGTGVSATSSIGNGIHAVGFGAGVFAQSGSSAGFGIHAVGGGVSPGTSPAGPSAVFAEGGPHKGLIATSNGDFGVFGVGFGGAFGVGGESTDTGIGTSGSSPNGTGVQGFSSSGTGVVGFSNSSGTGVSGSSVSGTGVSAGSTSGTGLLATSSSGDGISGSSGTGTGVHGSSTFGLAGLFDGNILVNGNFSATGTKAFVQAHPTDPGREIVYVALEGGEAGTYVRGIGQLQSGKAVLALPEHFGLVTTTEGLTIQLTPRGEWLQLYVVELDAAQIVVREAQGKSGAFDYLIHGVRRGYEQHEVIRTRR